MNYRTRRTYRAIAYWVKIVMGLAIASYSGIYMGLVAAATGFAMASGHATRFHWFALATTVTCTLGGIAIVYLAERFPRHHGR